MPIPPWAEVWDVLRTLLAPAVGASLVAMLVARLLGGERFAPIAAVLALTAGVVAGNHFREAMPWRLDSDRPLTHRDARLALGWSLEGKPPATDESAPIEELTVPSSRYWLPWLAALAMLVELVLRIPGIPPQIGWSIRGLVAAFAARVLTPPDLRLDTPWSPWALAATIALSWAILQALAQRWKDGTVPFVAALLFGAASAVILHAHSARLTDIALLFAAGLVGPALIAWWRPSDVGGVAPAVAVVLPALLLNGQHETFSEVPWQAFAWVALAPLALVPMLVPWLARRERWLRWVPAVLLPLGPAAWGVSLAAKAESLPF